ncbi:MAG: UDP-N-acetylmuramoyl-tripeptide--D-alanyl-D-alanine ligase [Bdellovibrionaceae bacterium]|nr:UDP-N-acetylmuramoyl-tripeptide--D-alanyl-D-alanine ligase [Pseudobdellovibrionaceae bacterium]
MVWRMTLQDVLAATGGKALSTHENSFSSVGTDTRARLEGQLFFALKGERFDAHDFLEQAASQGASAIVAHRLPESEELRRLTERTTVILVDDTLSALQALGRFWRRRMKARILGVTGTNGKTTTKEFTAAILSTRFRVQFSKGSFNNHWGVPISLLTISPEHEVAVIEMGMNHPGEIQTLVGLAEPDAVAVTMVGRGHLEGVGSIEGVAQAKEEIYRFAPPGATMIFNLDNPWTRKMYEKRSAQPPAGRAAGSLVGSLNNWRVITLSSDAAQAVDVHLRLVETGADFIRVAGRIANVSGEARVPVFGAHNVNNLMVAAGFALDCGMSADQIWKALPQCRAGWGRNQWVALAGGGRVLFDAYNANPESMRAALENFKGLQPLGRKVAVIGEMREMGAEAPAVHREMGEVAGRAGFDAIYFVGPSKTEFSAGVVSSGFSKTLVTSDSCEQFLASGVAPVIDPADIVLMKGSRGVQLERILKEWKPLDFQSK